MARIQTSLSDVYLEYVASFKSLPSLPPFQRSRSLPPCFSFLKGSENSGPALSNICRNTEGSREDSTVSMNWRESEREKEGLARVPSNDTSASMERRRMETRYHLSTRLARLLRSEEEFLPPCTMSGGGGYRVLYRLPSLFFIGYRDENARIVSERYIRYTSVPFRGDGTCRVTLSNRCRYKRWKWNRNGDTRDLCVRTGEEEIEEKIDVHFEKYLRVRLIF